MYYTVTQIFFNVWVTWIISVSYIHGTHAQFGTYSFSLINKPTNQSSVYSDGKVIGSSDKAVDGNLSNNFYQSSCTHTKSNDEQTWWAVDMGDLVTVFSITITNRGDCCHERLNKFSVYGSTTAFNPYEDGNKKLCHMFDGEVGPGATQTFNCSEAVTARYVSITVPPDVILNLCEVQIQAVCLDNTYGEDCTGMCSSNCKNPPCDKFTASGTCLEGLNGKCMAGYMGDNCSTPCPLGTYGDGCQPCSPFCKNNCAQTSATGVCNNGCLAGYMGDVCTTECASGYYGENCVENCYCKQGMCDHRTGLGCRECMDGYIGETCSVRVTTDTSTTSEKITKVTDTTTISLSAYVDNTPGGAVKGDDTQEITVGVQQSKGGTLSMCTTETMGVLTIGLAVPLAVLGALCVVLITVLVMKQYKTRQSDDLSASRELNHAPMYVNVVNNAATVETQKNLKTEIKYEDISLNIHNGRSEAGGYEKLDSLEVERALHQPYQELRK